MDSKKISAILIVSLWISLIIIVLIQMISIFSQYGKINVSLSFPYQSSVASPIEKLNINVDEGNIEIRYIDPGVDYYGLIEIDFMMIGVNVAGKSYEDYFDIQWYEFSSPANFTFKIISNDWYNPSLWIKKDINIILNLRKDIVFEHMDVFL
ncbi:MAG: hypothetical protein P8Y23_04185 [Candidatus Lokiarchaeota archaeon]